jgi:hypothetical protein
VYAVLALWLIVDVVLALVWPVRLREPPLTLNRI